MEPLESFESLLSALVSITMRIGAVSSGNSKDYHAQTARLTPEAGAMLALRPVPVSLATLEARPVSPDSAFGFPDLLGLQFRRRWLEPQQSINLAQAASYSDIG